jgi:hypothetical protein
MTQQLMSERGAQSIEPRLACVVSSYRWDALPRVRVVDTATGNSGRRLRHSRNLAACRFIEM